MSLKCIGLRAERTKVAVLLQDVRGIDAKFGLSGSGVVAVHVCKTLVNILSMMG